LIDAARLDMDAGEKQEGSGLIKLCHVEH
jgi:hypothetical protein